MLQRGPFYEIMLTFWSSWWSSDSIAATQICWLNLLRTSVIFFPTLRVPQFVLWVTTTRVFAQYFPNHIFRCFSNTRRDAGAFDRKAAGGVGQRLWRGVLGVPGVNQAASHHALRPRLLPTVHHSGHQHWAGTAHAAPRQMLYKENCFPYCVSVFRKEHVVLSAGVRSRPMNWWSFHLRKWRKTRASTQENGGQAQRF